LIKFTIKFIIGYTPYAFAVAHGYQMWAHHWLYRFL